MTESNVNPTKPERLLREKEVLQRIPVSKSGWWRGVREGHFPAPIKIAPRVTCWRESDIDALMSR
ncbi:MAG: AlpA family phage regulatory protein [Hyphomicrobiales bacterium]|nr:MAG: AlpA family phage regulatory protein [Hyphomicrobiales bacterium]